MEVLKKAKKVLIVDNDTSYTVPLRNALTKAGYEVSCIDDGQKALDLIKGSQIDIIISEVELPQLNGHALFNEIHSMPACKLMPFIFISSQKRVDDRIKSIELGVDDYITKPFFVEEVVARIEALFEEISQLNQEQSPSEKNFSGSLAEMNLVDLIQTMELGKKSAILKLTNNASMGIVYIVKGEVVDSSLEDLSPEQAIMRMFTWTMGNFYVEITSLNRERVLPITNKELLSNGLRRINQWEQVRQGLPPLNTVVTKTDLNTYEGLSDDERELISSMNEKKMLYEIIEKSRFDDLKALELVKGLFQKGYLQETEDNYVSNTDNYLARLKKKLSNSRTTNEGVTSIIAKMFKNSGNENGPIEPVKNERRQLPDRRNYDRRRDDRLKEPAPIYLTKTDLLLIRERLS